MAREYGRIKTAIWDDEDFLALTTGAQWLYKLILTQRELNLCGVIRPAYGRWASFSKDATQRSVKKWAAELTEAKYILADNDWDELLAELRPPRSRTEEPQRRRRDVPSLRQHPFSALATDHHLRAEQSPTRRSDADPDSTYPRW